MFILTRSGGLLMNLDRVRCIRINENEYGFNILADTGTHEESITLTSFHSENEARMTIKEIAYQIENSQHNNIIHMNTIIKAVKKKSEAIDIFMSHTAERHEDLSKLMEVQA